MSEPAIAPGAAPARPTSSKPAPHADGAPAAPGLALHSDPARDPSRGMTAPERDVIATLDGKLRPMLTDAARARERRRAFARAVAKISAELKVPISEAQAMREMPCGGWSGPSCPNLTVGLDIAKVSAPVIASFHRKRTADIVPAMVDAVAIHSVWHDAYGYVRRVKKKGPGYTYAGCLFSRCDPDDLKNGQVDGLLYQVGRLLGAQTGPACGPACTLPDP
ncbi:MAG TPA: hypothetical protein VK698_15325 [Kofleriaceae bacterium]|nr:hypothetical protein [Kofleriaceae bacterium]